MKPSSSSGDGIGSTYGGLENLVPEKWKGAEILAPLCERQCRLYCLKADESRCRYFADYDG
jgi:hypothetical protein